MHLSNNFISMISKSRFGGVNYRQICVQCFRAGFLTALDWKPRFVLDAGANVGLAARLFAALWPNATIVSLEPDRSNFAVLKLNAALAQNILPQNVSPLGGVSLQPPGTACESSVVVE